MSRLTLQEQLRQLEQEDQPRTYDSEEAYSSLDALNIPSREGEEGREHYLDVGPSRLRAQVERDQGGQTLLGDKYAGKTTGRMKIFDDDEEEEEEDGVGMNGHETNSDEEGEDEDEEDEDEGEYDEEEEEEDGEEEEEDEEDDGEEEEDGDEEAQPTPGPSRPSRALDPVSSLRAAREKDVEKGRGIRRQKALFDTIITLRITFQKALVAATALSQPLPSDPSGELDKQRIEAIQSLADLSDKLLEVRSLILLPGAELEPSALGKRKRTGDVDDDYLLSAGQDALAIANTQHAQLLSILNKWSSKINAASLAVNSKTAGSSKFLASSKSQPGAVEAIEAGLANKKEAGKTLLESEEAGYRLLLKEVIEARSGGSGGADLTHLRREKKKKREAERGGSKGRKLRYTVHDKAANFVVPIPLRNGWHDDQMDELFGSLFGGAGLSGASAETAVTVGGVVDVEEGLASLGGLRVF